MTTSLLDWTPPFLIVRGRRFKASTFSGARAKKKWLVIWKDRPLVEAFAAILDELKPRRIFEIGIALGGSTGFIATYAEPEKLVAIDYSPEPVESLAGFIERNELQESVATCYGVDQADRDRVRAIARDEFGDSPLDLVIDDASHRLVETRASFETLFPRLRPGGLYLIEDWQWGLTPLPPEERARDPERYSFWPPGQPLALLGMELLLAAAHSEFVASVEIDQHFIRVTRGPGELDDDFRLAQLYPPEAAELVGRHAVLANDQPQPPVLCGESRRLMGSSLAEG